MNMVSSRARRRRSSDTVKRGGRSPQQAGALLSISTQRYTEQYPALPSTSTPRHPALPSFSSVLYFCLDVRSTAMLQILKDIFDVVGGVFDSQ